MSTHSQAPPLSPAKRRTFMGVMLLAPVLFFVLLEGTLRLAGYGDAYPLFVEVEDMPGYLYQNRDVARRYFTHLRVIPNSLHDFFEAEKNPEVFRIFVQGGSSAAGFPYYYGGAFSRMLEQRLAQTFPERPIEVINTAMSAVNSYTMLDFADEIIAQQPDAVLIYAGHNEYYGALGVGSSERFGASRFVTNTYLRLVDLRTVQALRDGIGAVAGLFGRRAPGEAPSGTMMERMVGEQTIPYGSPLYEAGLAQFRGNLSDLLAIYRDHNIPVFISTLASNERDHTPFVSGLSPDTDEAAWEAAYRRARAAADAGDLNAALALLEDVIGLDSLSAQAFYTQAQWLERLGRYDEARAAYLDAKDRDELRFRAPEAMNRIVRDVAARHGAVVVETQAALAEVSPNGLIGSNLMTEHLHPNVEGYLRIADAFYEALQQAGLIGAWTHPVPLADARAEVLLTPVDSLVGVYRIRALMGQWPFQPPGVVDRSLDTLRGTTVVEQLALALYRGEKTWLETNTALQQYYDAQGDYHRALQAALVQIQEYPLLDTPYLVAGNVLIKQRRYDEALAYFENANAVRESASAQRMIGSILLQRGDREAAVEHLQRALALDPNDAAALYNLAGAYAMDGHYARAHETVDRLLRLNPDHQDGRRLLASLPEVE